MGTIAVIRWNGQVRLNTKSRYRRWVGKGKKLFEVQGPVNYLVLDFVPFRGMRPLALVRPARGESPRVTLRLYLEVNMKKRQPASDKAPSRHLASLSSHRLEGWIPLVEHCALLQYDEGEPRKPGKFFVETQGTAWKVTVKDPDTATQFAVIAPTLPEALDAASLLLACDDAPWEPDTWALDRAKKSKK